MQPAIRDPWVWQARFADGSALDEYDASEPSGHGWAAVREYAATHQTRLTQVVLIPQRPHLSSHVIAILGEATIVRVFRRRSITLDSGAGVEVGERPDAITCVALTCGDYAAYTFLFADGSVVMADNLNAV